MLGRRTAPSSDPPLSPLEFDILSYAQGHPVPFPAGPTAEAAREALRARGLLFLNQITPAGEEALPPMSQVTIYFQPDSQGGYFIVAEQDSTRFTTRDLLSAVPIIESRLRSWAVAINQVSPRASTPRPQLDLSFLDDLP